MTGFCGKYLPQYRAAVPSERKFSRCAHQPLHETDQPLLVHGVLINHETDAALAADGRDHIDPLLPDILLLFRG